LGTKPVSHCLECRYTKKRDSLPIEGSLFCKVHQPASNKKSPYTIDIPLRYGYYLASSDSSYGDGKCAYEAKAIYESFGFDIKFANKFDGVSVYFRENNTIVKRVILRDFFSDEPKIVCRDYPFNSDK
jgi:hypothetical protein